MRFLRSCLVNTQITNYKAEKSNDENLGSYAEGLKAITPEEQANYSIEYINQKAEKLGYAKVEVNTYGGADYDVYVNPLPVQ